MLLSPLASVLCSDFDLGMRSSLASPSAGLDSSSLFLDSFSLSKATFVMSLDPPDSTLTPLAVAFGSVESLLAGRLVLRGISY